MKDRWNIVGCVLFCFVVFGVQAQQQHPVNKKAWGLFQQARELEIDPPVDEIAIRRKGFYERCGFTANPYPHVHPAYHKGVRWHDLVLMSRPDGLTDKQCRAYQAYLADVVMRNAY